MLVLVADTWLHITTKTVNFVQLTPGRRIGNNYVDRYGFGMRPQCTRSNNSYNTQRGSSEDTCSLIVAATYVYVVNPDESMRVLNNVSDHTVVETVSGSAVGNTPYTASDDTSRDNGGTADAGSDTATAADPRVPFAFLAPQRSEALARTDYTAPTFAMQTRCRPVTNECGLHEPASGHALFNCAPLLPAFVGNVLATTWSFITFTDATGSNNRTVDGVENPFYFGIAALVNVQGSPVPRNTDLGWLTPKAGRSFVLFCNATVFDAQHTHYNGSSVGAGALHSLRRANASVANIVHGIAAHSGPGTMALRQAANVAALSNTSQAMADGVALAFSRVGIGAAAGAFERRPVLAAQYRRSMLVARVPVAPLAALVAANLLLALLGAGLTVVALVTVAAGRRRSGGGREREAAEVQARLSIAGIVTDRFEGARARQPVDEVEDMFGERRDGVDVRVGVDRSGETGGWEYKAWQSGPAALLHYS